MKVILDYNPRFVHINSRKRPLAEKNTPNIRPMKVTKKSMAVFSQKDKDDERQLENAISRAFIGIIISFYVIYSCYFKMMFDTFHMQGTTPCQ